MIVPGSRLAELTAAVADVVPDVISADAPDLDRPVVVLSVTQAKGLEFDAVLVADPTRILADSPRGPERSLRGDHPGNPAPGRGV